MEVRKRTGEVEVWGKAEGKLGSLGLNRTALLHLPSPLIWEPFWAGSNVGFQNANVLDEAFQNLNFHTSQLPLNSFHQALVALRGTCNRSTHGCVHGWVSSSLSSQDRARQTWLLLSQIFLVLQLQHTFGSSSGSLVLEVRGVMLKSI